MIVFVSIGFIIMKDAMSIDIKRGFIFLNNSFTLKTQEYFQLNARIDYLSWQTSMYSFNSLRRDLLT